MSAALSALSPEELLRRLSKDGREISRPLKVLLVTFFLLTVLGLTLHSAVINYLQLSRQLTEQSATAENFLLYQEEVGSAGLERALAALFHNRQLLETIKSGELTEPRSEIRAFFEEMRKDHRVSELSIYCPDLSLLMRGHESAGSTDAASAEQSLTRRARETLSTTHGLEIGDLGTPVIAVVRPFYDKQGQLIGLVRMAMEITDPLNMLASTLSSDLIVAIPTGDMVPDALTDPRGSEQRETLTLHATTTGQNIPAGISSLLSDAPGSRSFLQQDRILLNGWRVLMVRSAWRPVAGHRAPLGVLIVRDITPNILLFTLHSLGSLFLATLFAVLTGTVALRLIKRLQASVARTRDRLESSVATKTQALEESRSRLQEAQRIASLGSWERNLRTGEHAWSEEMFRITGISPELTADEAYVELRKLRKPLETALIRIKLEDAIRSCGRFDYLYQLTRPDGTERTMHVLGYVLAGEDGKAEWVIGTTHDITDQHDAIEHGRWLSEIMEASLNEIYVADATTLRFQHANACALSNLQMTMDELAEKTLGEVMCDENGERTGLDLAPLLTGKTNLLWTNGLHRRRDGTVYPVETRIQLHRTGYRQTIVAICNDISERVARERETHLARKRAERLAYFDDLTNLPNRAACQRDASLRFQAEVEHRPRFLLHMDIDNFKRINDTLGHSAGDACLAQTGERLRLCCAGLGIAYRWGGDEFVVVAQGPDCDLEDLCERLAAVMRAPMDVAGHQIWPTVSIGAARCPEDGESFERLLVKADLALYHSKDGGKDRWTCFTRDLKDRSDQEAALEADLRRALQEDEFFLVFQPQVNLRTHQVTGVEALVRWQHPTKGELSPGLFLPVVEKTNLAAPLGRMVINKALMAARELKDRGLDFGRIAVNLSPAHLKTGTLMQDFQNAMDAHGVGPELLTAEVLESVFFNDPSHSNAKLLQDLHDLGLHIELDDFGTGFASLSHLADLPITGLKIDRSFTARLLTDRKKEIVTNHLIHLARALEINVVCEGVETDAQFERLRMMGNFSVQGYLIARPMPFATLTTWLNTVQSDVTFTVT
ncbi:bifunctional diguanylate cyclase/phosphodiesterase [Roseibium aestuarii]|uniref:EAL domain-containing protein n=1 Tax=Roseibium aestuarii TaxID=2600299 RepID=A0ABW4JXA0_9HYPH|nr:EAL domain-containing protein [Roseibium aestuarii]